MDKCIIYDIHIYINCSFIFSSCIGNSTVFYFFNQRRSASGVVEYVSNLNRVGQFFYKFFFCRSYMWLKLLSDGSISIIVPNMQELCAGEMPFCFKKENLGVRRFSCL